MIHLPSLGCQYEKGRCWEVPFLSAGWKKALGRELMEIRPHCRYLQLEGQLLLFHLVLLKRKDVHSAFSGMVHNCQLFLEALTGLSLVCELSRSCGESGKGGSTVGVVWVQWPPGSNSQALCFPSKYIWRLVLVTEHAMLLGVMTSAFESCADRTNDCRSPTAQAVRPVLPPSWSQCPCPCLPHVAVLSVSCC